MSANLNAKAVDINFSSGLRQDLEGKIAPPGALSIADNVEFDQLNRLVRRDGFARIGASTYTKGYSLSSTVRRIVEGAAGERLMFNDLTNYVYFPGVDKVSQAGISLRQDNVRAVMTNTLGVVASEVGTIAFSACCAVGTNVVHAYIATDPTGGTPTLYIDAIDTTTGSRPLAGLSYGTSLSVQPRCVLSGGSSVVFVLFASAANTIKYIKLDFTGTTITAGLATALVSDAEATPVFDADTMASGWIFCYGQSSGTHQAVVTTYSSTPASTHTFSWLDNGGASNWTPTTLAVCGDSQASATNVMAAGYDGATFKLETVYLSNVLAGAVYKNIDPGLSHTKHAKVMTIGRQDTTNWTVAFSNYTSTTLTTNPRGHLYIYTCNSSNPPATQGTFANYTLASKFYRHSTSGTLLAAARFDDPSGFQNHLLLLDFGSSFGAYGFPAPAMHFASGRIQLQTDNAATCVGGVADLGSGSFQINYPINAGANQISGNLVEAYSFQALSSQRYLNTTAQGCVIAGGGTPLTFDGQRLVELGFYSYPCMGSGSYTPNAAGGSIAQGIYQYRAVYEWTDAHGNRQQSPASPAITIDMSSATYVAGTNSVAVVAPTLHATRKQQSNFITDTASPVRVVHYRTKAGPGGVFYRLAVASVNNTATTADDASITDIYADATIAVNEPLYEKNGGQGLLSSTAAPPTIAITTHAQRVWGVDCENPERIWCTRVLSQLSAPAYNAALQILIPGAGRINGLGGQDGKLYALATAGVYLASYGDGPDDTGAGAFPSPQLITIDANCTEPRGVLIGADGIFFVGDDQWGTGIYLIRRGDGTALSIGKRVRTELAAFPICRGVVDRVSKCRTEFLFVDSDTAPTAAAILYYHHDYVDAEGIGQWTTAKIGTALECLGAWNDISVVADTSANVSIQTVGTLQDFASTTPVVGIATCDLRPFGLVGYGQITGLTLLGTMSAADPIKVELSYDSGSTWADSTQFLATSETAGAPVLRQFQSPTSKLPNGGSFRVRLTDPTLGGSGPGKTFFHGVSIESQPLGGNARLADSQRA
jgi:hypothetical protein